MTFASGNGSRFFLPKNRKSHHIMNNETHLDATALITPEILQAVKNLQQPDYVPMLIRHLEEMLDFFIEDICTDLNNDQKLEHIRVLRITQKSLKPFAVPERTIDEEGGES